MTISEHPHRLLRAVPLSGISRRDGLFSSEKWFVHEAWKSSATILSASSQIQPLLLKVHFDLLLEDGRSHSEPADLQPQLQACASAFIHKVADFVRLPELSWFPKMRAVYRTCRLQGCGIRFRCTLHTFSPLQLPLKPLLSSCYTTCTQNAQAPLPPHKHVFFPFHSSCVQNMWLKNHPAPRNSANRALQTQDPHSISPWYWT